MMLGVASAAGTGPGDADVCACAGVTSAVMKVTTNEATNVTAAEGTGVAARRRNLGPSMRPIVLADEALVALWRDHETAPGETSSRPNSLEWSPASGRRAKM